MEFTRQQIDEHMRTQGYDSCLSGGYAGNGLIQWVSESEAYRDAREDYEWEQRYNNRVPRWFEYQRN